MSKSDTEIEAIAAAFVEARRQATKLDDFPGDLPATLEEAYRVQDKALELDMRPVGGWKVAGVHPDLQAKLGATRIVGPIYADNIRRMPKGGMAEVSVFEGGFAALEAEFTVVFAKDLEAGPNGFSDDVILNAIGAIHAGAEIASSPLATLNALGPTAVVSDHGNNAGAVVGPVIDGWKRLTFDAMTSRMLVDGAVVGEGSAAKVANGPLESVRLLAENLASRGRILHAGDVVLTGMTTGIHEVLPGACGRAEFAGAEAFEIVVKAAMPRG
ncbi:2-keto-4-pentenoate hydratase [Martelella alba]|uniref:2-keto-4-pentenoate hydratase n=1 Tax=Martelella alba TaxID=2590451 RepID=A0A506U721_9HYPH|nr:fumarylacetoacetate hydrolase family protein [Martelella alba]TPW28891.1 2-keto-4-pentenoate hydratase [Martelella alba]